MGLLDKKTTPADVHPIIRRCLTHLDILGADDKLKQIVYMYMETLCQEADSTDNAIVDRRHK
ncbi:hypothetical protein CYL18_09740 [Pradoshia eiseniae]|uniref:Uncharacterized protein n=1 Tax=Pradoshia eiseniae TaxID=2064768 RepID=A0A2S7N0P5_9BACI|nr:hypothetical protein CYL18_09740 [Pradoshia eiseniae]